MLVAGEDVEALLETRRELGPAYDAALVDSFADDNILLRKPLVTLYETVQEFRVAVRGREVVGDRAGVGRRHPAPVDEDRGAGVGAQRRHEVAVLVSEVDDVVRRLLRRHRLPALRRQRDLPPVAFLQSHHQSPEQQRDDSKRSYSMRTVMIAALMPR